MLSARMELTRSYGISQDGVKAALWGNAVLPASFVGKDLVLKLSSVIRKDY